MLYRKRDTGELRQKTELRNENPNMSLPREWNENVLEALGVDRVKSTFPPETGPMQIAIRDGAVQDSEGNWEVNWVVQDRFSDDETGTKAEKEAEWQIYLDNEAADVNRQIRDRLIGETDWWAMSDRTMTAEQTAYRQALRDISTHSNWPHLEISDWPTKP